MKLTQHKIKWLARLMLGLVLFTQGMAGASACLTANASPAQAYAVNEPAMPCHDATQANANVCLQQCTQADQINIDQHILVAAPVAVPVLTLAPPATPSLRSTYASYIAPNSGPPLTIRFCSFLI